MKHLLSFSVHNLPSNNFTFHMRNAKTLPEFNSLRQTSRKSGIVLSPKNKRTLIGIDLFAGAGGFSQAAKNVGLKIVAAVEMCVKACETYEANLVSQNNPRLYQSDIRKLDPALLNENHFANGLECDVILGGPPCQGFSIHRLNNSGVNDPRNELVLSYFQFVRHLRPKVFLMENVPGLLWPRHELFLNKLYKQGKAAGYDLYEPVVIDARDFGVPQRRKRVFILGVRNDIKLNIEWPPSPTHGDEKARAVDDQLQPWTLAASVFSIPIPVGDENDVHMNHSIELVNAFRRTPKNGGSRNESGRTLPCHVNHNGHRDVYGRIDPAQPGPTMTTACVNPSKGRFVHPTKHHGITLRQAARFQTFPDSFVFKGGLMAGGAQVGNAVPVRLGEALLKVIADGLLTQEIQ